jgi:hypothetical protein
VILKQVPGLSFRVSGFQFLVYGFQFLVYGSGLWFMVLVYGLWFFGLKPSRRFAPQEYPQTKDHKLSFTQRTAADSPFPPILHAEANAHEGDHWLPAELFTGS